MASFKVGSGPVVVDFQSNMPFDIWTAFAVYQADGSLWASKAEAYQTKPGEPDFVFKPGLTKPGILVCVFNCMRPGAPPADQLKIKVMIRQGENEKVYTLDPVNVLAGGTAANPIANVSIQYEVELV